jgi:hypothetical protein
MDQSMSSNLRDFTFINGTTVKVDRVSALLGAQVDQAVRAKHAAPSVPMNKVERPDGSFEDEPNPLNPAYRQQLLEYENKIVEITNRKYIDLVINMAVDTGKTDAEMRQELAQIVDQMRLLDLDFVPEPTVKISYIRYCCATNWAEINRLIEFVRADSIPTEEQITAIERTF